MTSLDIYVVQRLTFSLASSRTLGPLCFPDRCIFPPIPYSIPSLDRSSTNTCHKDLRSWCIMTYQNGGPRVVMGENDGLLKVKPMDYLESRRRRNRCVSIALLALFLITCGTLVAWRVRHPSDSKGATSTVKHGTSDNSEDDYVPPVGLVELNKGLKSQSKVMKEGCESTLLIMRHCEKMGGNQVDTDGNYHCSYLGHERSYFIPTLFGKRWPNPSQLFALTPERDTHLNFREYETLHPLSLKTGIPVDLVDQTNLPSQFFRLLQSGDMCGKLTVVCWKHSIIPALAQNLGCIEDDGCPKHYPESSHDEVWQLKYVFFPDEAEDLQEEKDYIHNATRRLHRSKKRKGWKVFATISQQGFDPLSFSYEVGDYPDGGSPTGGSWKTEF